MINDAADQDNCELKSAEVHEIFQREYVNLSSPLELLSIQRKDFFETGEVSIDAQINFNGELLTISGRGNGPISAFAKALDSQGWKHFTLLDYRQHSIGSGSATDAAAYIQIQHESGSICYGCGINANIELAGLHALVSAFNRAHAAHPESHLG